MDLGRRTLYRNTILAMTIYTSSRELAESFNYRACLQAIVYHTTVQEPKNGEIEALQNDSVKSIECDADFPYCLTS